MASSSVIMGCIVVLIEVSSSGGFGGLPATGKHKSLDMNSLAEPAKTKICKLFDLEKLSLIASKTSHFGAADGVMYKIIIVDDKDNRHEFNLEENVLPAEILDVIDEL